VAKRKIKGSKAPNTSLVLSGLIAKRLGSGGLKLGGGAIVTEEALSEVGCSCWVLTEEVEEVSDMPLMQKLLLGSLLLGKETDPRTGNWERLKAIAMTLEKRTHRHKFLQVPTLARLFPSDYYMV